MGDKSDMDKPSGGSQRWVLVPDEENPRRMLWEWEPGALDDTAELFARVRDGTSTDVDHELFDGCMLDRFVSRVYAGEPVDAWIMAALADAFSKVLMGGEWKDEIRLPGRLPTPLRTAKEQRALEIYCAVTNAAKEGRGVTKAIKEAASMHSVSYETARDTDYYPLKKTFSKNDDKA